MRPSILYMKIMEMSSGWREFFLNSDSESGYGSHHPARRGAHWSSAPRTWCPTPYFTYGVEPYISLSPKARIAPKTRISSLARISHFAQQYISLVPWGEPRVRLPPTVPPHASGTKRTTASPSSMTMRIKRPGRVNMAVGTDAAMMSSQSASGTRVMVSTCLPSSWLRLGTERNW